MLKKINLKIFSCLGLSIFIVFILNLLSLTSINFASINYHLTLFLADFQNFIYQAHWRVWYSLLGIGLFYCLCQLKYDNNKFNSYYLISFGLVALIFISSLLFCFIAPNYINGQTLSLYLPIVMFIFVLRTLIACSFKIDNHNESVGGLCFFGCVLSLFSLIFYVSSDHYTTYANLSKKLDATYGSELVQMKVLYFNDISNYTDEENHLANLKFIDFPDEETVPWFHFIKTITGGKSKNLIDANLPNLEISNYSLIQFRISQGHIQITHFTLNPQDNHNQEADELASLCLKRAIIAIKAKRAELEQKKKTEQEWLKPNS